MGSFLIARTSRHLFVGEILDMYKKGASVGGRHSSIPSSSNADELSYISLRVYLPLGEASKAFDQPFSLFTNYTILQTTGNISDDDDPEHILEVTPTFSRTRPGHRYELHTHLDASQIMYHLGRKPFDMTNSSPRLLQLDREAAKNWYSFARPVVQKQLPKIRIPGGKMTRK